MYYFLTMEIRSTRFLVLLAFCHVAFFQSASAEPMDQSEFNLFAKENLVAWCVVPFDSEKRTSAERTRMLQELGFRSMAWDWRQEHLHTLETEISSLREADIELKAVWYWIDGNAQGWRSESNDQLLATLERTGTKTEIWVSFAARFFNGLNDTQKIAKASETVANLQRKAEAMGCTVLLYNHGEWFGEPRNMVRVIQDLNGKDIGLVYNFHHAHSQIDEFESNLALMMPYLRTVNLNGMRVDGPKILPLGSGDSEEKMIRQLKAAGFEGRIGILGHVEDADVKDILTENLAGMKKLLERMNETKALATY